VQYPQPPKVTKVAQVTKIPRTSTEWLTDAQLRFVQRLLTETGTDRDELLAYFGYETLDTIPKAEVNRVIKALESKRRAA
jgi:N-acetyl-anhydromuramyl-L-alanine amidase AmpD